MELGVLNYFCHTKMLKHCKLQNFEFYGVDFNNNFVTHEMHTPTVPTTVCFIHNGQEYCITGRSRDLLSFFLLVVKND